MKSLHLKATSTTPEFLFEVEESSIEFNGVSNIGRDNPFYTSVTEFLGVIEQGKPLRLKCVFDLSKICRVSKRGLLFFLIGLKDLNRNHNTQLIIDWVTDPQNELVRSIGENLEYMVRLKMNFIEKTPVQINDAPVEEMAF